MTATLLLIANHRFPWLAPTANRLKQSGYAVVHVEMIDFVASLLAQDHFDLILIGEDTYSMTTGSVETCLQAIKGISLAPTILISTSDDPRAAEAAFQTGVNDFARMPLDIDSLTARVSRLLEDHKGRVKLEAEKYNLSRELDRCRQELNKANAMLRRNRMVADDFTRNIAHELRTPLTVIKGYAAILADELCGELNSTQHAYLQTVMSRVEDLGRTVNDMVDISRLDAGAYEIERHTFNWSELITPIYHALERRRAFARVEFEIDTGDQTPRLFCDRDSVARAILSILIFACKISSEPAMLAFQTRSNESVRTGLLEMRISGAELQLEKFHALEQCLGQVDSDVRQKCKGAGYSLKVAKSLINLNHGEIALACSSPDSFEIQLALPLTKTEALYAAKRSPAPGELGAARHP